MFRNINASSGVTQAQVQSAAAAAIAAADIAGTTSTAVAGALADAGLSLAAIADVVPQPNTGTQRVQGAFSGADTELKVLWGFEGQAYRLYGYRITASVAPSEVTFCAGEADDSLPIGPTHSIAIGSQLVGGTTEFIGVLDTTMGEGVVLRKTAGATLTYEIDFDYI